MPPQCASAAAIAVPNMSSGNGYVFYNCEITGNAWSTGGSLGRPWNRNGEAVYINTTIGSSARNGASLAADWSSMSGSEPQNARFGEYGLKDKSGSTINTASWKHGYTLNEWTMLRFNPYTQIEGSDGWDPSGIHDEKII